MTALTCQKMDERAISGHAVSQWLRLESQSRGPWGRDEHTDAPTATNRTAARGVLPIIVEIILTTSFRTAAAFSLVATPVRTMTVHICGSLGVEPRHPQARDHGHLDRTGM
jgi:hypothetical protein